MEYLLFLMNLLLIYLLKYYNKYIPYLCIESISLLTSLLSLCDENPQSAKNKQVKRKEINVLKLK
jgi:hypothetical protein